MPDQEGSSAARAVPGYLRQAAVGVVELNISFYLTVNRSFHQEPAVRTYARVPVANGARKGGKIILRRLLEPGQQEVILRTVSLGEFNLHCAPAGGVNGPPIRR